MGPTETAAKLRQMALDMPAPLGASSSGASYGFIVEFRQNEAVVTLTAFSTGDASLYLSSGGGIIGLIGKPEIAKLARETVDAVAAFATELPLSQEAAPPGPGEYCFYILTPAGRRVCRVNGTGTARADGPEVKLIRLGGALLTKVRERAN